MTTQRQSDIGELLARAKQHDDEALAELISGYTDRLLEFIRIELGDRIRQRLESQDVMQQVYVDALRCIDTFEGRGDDSFLRWLEAIAVNRIRDAHRHHFQTRKRGGELRAADLNFGESWMGVLDAVSRSQGRPSYAAQRFEKVRLLQHALSQLGDRQRQAVELRYLNQLSVAEAAERLGCSERALRSLCVRALMRLRELLGDAV
jgi:RNA polymerase sigma-70 factor (ECF subfamily)